MQGLNFVANFDTVFNVTVLLTIDLLYNKKIRMFSFINVSEAVKKLDQTDIEVMILAIKMVILHFQCTTNCHSQCNHC